jgi:hypothetical protein
VYVAPSCRSREDEVEDGRFDAMGCVKPWYPYFAVFYVLSPMRILFFLSFVWAYK